MGSLDKKGAALSILPLLVLGVLVLVGLAMLITGIVIVGGHRAWGLAAIAVGALILLAPVAAATWMFTLGSRQPSAWVEGLNPDTDPRFIIRVSNSRDFQDGLTYSFTPHMSEDEFLDLLDEKFPEGKAGGGSFWHIWGYDVRYEIVASETEGWYSLETQVATVTPEAGGPEERIAFPSSAHDVRTLAEGTPLSTTWAPDDWFEFYDGIGISVTTPHSITVPTSRGNSAMLTFTDGQVTVALSD